MLWKLTKKGGIPRLDFGECSRSLSMFHSYAKNESSLINQCGTCPTPDGGIEQQTVAGGGQREQLILHMARDS